MEALEERCLLAATITVNSLADTDAGDGTLSLREAIQVANGTLAVSALSPAQHAQVAGDPTTGLDTIDFNLPTTTADVIALQSPLDTIVHPVSLDGTSQPGYSGAPLVRIDGGALTGGDGLVLGAGSDGSTIQGLDVRNLAAGFGVGIHILSSGNTITGNVLGNDTHGIEVDGPAAQGNLIRSNDIGTDATGTANLGNASNGVYFVFNASNNRVGPGNVISFNHGDGVDVESGTGNSVQGNTFNGNIGEDIFLQAAGNHQQQAPALVTSRYDPALGKTLVTLVVYGNPNDTIQVDFSLTPASNFTERSFLPPVAQPGQTMALPLIVKMNGHTSQMIMNWAVSDTDLSQPAGAALSATETLLVPQGGGTAPSDTSAFSLGLYVASEYAVTTTDDGPPGNPPIGSLRAAIEAANANPALSKIFFNLPASQVQSFQKGEVRVPGYLIGVGDPLDLTAGNVEILGSTSNYPVQLDGFLIAIAGASSESEATLFLTGSNDLIEGLTFSGNSNANSAAVVIQGGGDKSLENDRFGTDLTGLSNASNANGIIIDQSNGNTIGGPGSLLSVLISGNTGNGVIIRNGSSNNTIENTFIGTDPTGAFSNTSLVNLGNGIDIENSPDNMIGTSDEANVISGNDKNGILINGPASTGNVVVNTHIGTDRSGSRSDQFLANGADGILIENASNNTIGAPGVAPNVISGNFGNGIHILTTDPSHVASGNHVFQSLIGTDISGTTSRANLGNAANGVLIEDSFGNSIGAPGALNLISGNLGAGVEVLDSGTITKPILVGGTPVSLPIGQNVIQGDEIGTTLSGVLDLGNGSDGIEIINSAGNIVGGFSPAAGNLVTGNNGNGVLISGSGAQYNVLQGNVLGARTAANPTSGNAFNGVAIASASNNQIGGDTPGTGNTIAGNGSASFERARLSSVPLTSGRNDATAEDNYVAAVSGRFTSANNSGLVVVDQQSNPLGLEKTLLRVLLSDGTGSFSAITSTDAQNAFPAFDPGPFSIVRGNFTGGASGLDDVAVVSQGTQNAYVFQPDGHGGFRLKETIALGAFGTPMALAAGPGAGEFVVAVKVPGADMSELLVFSGMSATPLATFQAAGTVNGLVVAALDPSKPSFGDIVVSSFLSDAAGKPLQSQVQVFLNQGNNLAFTPLAPFAVGVAGVDQVVSIASGQFNPLNPQNPNGDNFPDLVVVTGDATGGPMPGKAFLFEGNGGGGFTLVPPSGSPNSSYLVGGNPGPAVVGDFEGNGLSDVAILNPRTSQVTILSGLGNGQFNTPNNYDVGTSPTAIAVVASAGGGESIAVINVSVLGNASTLRSDLRILTGGRYNGVVIAGPDATGNAVQGNIIGLDISGTTARGNAADGIRLDGADHNLIGGVRTTTSAPGNIISGNIDNGIHVTGAQPPAGQENVILGNLIGTDASGRTAIDFTGHALGNHENGILVDGVRANIGSAVPGGANIISGNLLNGVDVRNAMPNPSLLQGAPSSAAGTLILGNTIGLDVSGSTAVSPGGTANLGNGLDGILVDNVAGVTIGGVSNFSRNVVSGNQGSGIEVRGQNNPGSSLQVLILSNLVGLDGTGSRANDARGRPLGNFNDGILVNGAFGVSILGDTNPADIDQSVISNNRGFGIHVVNHGPGPFGLLIAGVFIGTDATGEAVQAGNTSLGNGIDGVLLDSIDGGVIGDASITGNVIAGNRSNGIDLLHSSHVLIAGNHIGTGLSGQRSLGNTASGVLLNQSSNNQVGGGAPADRNIISGNLANGVAITGLFSQETSSNHVPRDNNSLAAYNVVAGNTIGLNAAGNSRLRNTLSGVFLSGALFNTIGAGNVISGNSGSGVEVGDNAGDNTILGNLIGTDSTGRTSADSNDGRSLGNSGDGITLVNVPGNLIASNVISGNNVAGAHIEGLGSFGNVLRNNLIGTDSTARVSIGNHADGVFLDHAAPNTVGGTAAGQGNVISGNEQNGVQVLSGGGNFLQGNKIGTDGGGTIALGNGVDGVLINGSSGNLIGGLGGEASVRNVISGNQQSGIAIFSPAPMALADGNIVADDLIGTDVTGTRALGNFGNGVLITDGDANLVGGFTSASGSSAIDNVIAANRLNGIQVISTLRPPSPAEPNGSGTNNVIDGNMIGLGSDGTTRLGNGANGVSLVNALNNRVGRSGGATGATTNVPLAPRNVISGNRGSGIQVSAPDGVTSADSIQGNWIGTTLSGRAALGNSGDGVLIDTAAGVLVGGLATGAGNLIAGNGNGVQILGDGTPGNLNDLVQGNEIGTDISGETALANSVGVTFNSAAGNILGSNLIAGNTNSGVQVIGFGSDGNLLEGNSIGIDAAGVAALGNVIGVFINNVVGTTVTGNTISGNTTAGAYVTGTNATSTLVSSNLIGLDRTGLRAIVSSAGAANAQSVGVLISGSVGNVVASNVISDNVVGVEVSTFDSNLATTGSTKQVVPNKILSNRVGTDVNGLMTQGNTVGIFINGLPDTVVGGLGLGNTIADSAQAGVLIYGSLAHDSTIQDNTIEAGAQTVGIGIQDSSTNSLLGNTITLEPNGVAGIYILGHSGSSEKNLVRNNTIGGGGEYGVLLYNAPNNEGNQSGTTANHLGSFSIAAYREFSGTATLSNSTGQTTPKTTKKPAVKKVPHTHPSTHHRAAKL